MPGVRSQKTESRRRAIREWGLDVLFFIGYALIIGFCIILVGSCVTVSVEKSPDGVVRVDYARYLVPQKFEDFIVNLDTGELMFEKQESDTERLVGAAVEGAVRGLRP